MRMPCLDAFNGTSEIERDTREEPDPVMLVRNSLSFSVQGSACRVYESHLLSKLSFSSPLRTVVRIGLSHNSDSWISTTAGSSVAFPQGKARKASTAISPLGLFGLQPC
ncbi:uncharacterized protein BDZ83DRAFT_615195 [Colletotrichum acutatum]|uniref:Uncharacterized protein n=1 Tax=Glomerella acutata TaxID=27357 RepID=A0AAD8UPV8_GLOAC|nr:uncharacterized protein BDZ83DRAFT_615195 [Colletotrichum acutatum]KAK1726697.1 hypothetical protein BDZ83DRAFT_615195 [Colletotrichum acutatum]